MAISTVKICNMALALIGHSRITNATLSDADEAERQCAVAFPILRDELLQSHPWNFAEARQTLSALSDTPDFEYTTFYGLPANCLQPLYLYDSLENFREEADRRIATNASPCNLVYTKRVEDVSQFSQLFIAALKYKLAEHLATVLSDNNTLADRMEGKAREALSKARVKDAQSGVAKKNVYRNNWISRRAGWSDFRK